MGLLSTHYCSVTSARSLELLTSLTSLTCLTISTTSTTSRNSKTAIFKLSVDLHVSVVFFEIITVIDCDVFQNDVKWAW